MNKLEYYQEIHKVYKDTFTLEDVIKNIKECKQNVFIKYGDGEVECMKVIEKNSSGYNCDQDVYFPELSKELKEAFLYFVNESNNYNIHIGKWHFVNESNYLSKLYYENENQNIYKLIPFTNYHLVMNDKDQLSKNSMYQFVESIKKSNDYLKIIVSNEQNQLLKTLFSGNFFIETPSKCLYLELDRIIESIYKIMDENKDKKVMILTSCGLSAKVLIYRLLKKYETRVSAIDLGSSFDLLCKKRVTRSYQIEYSYDTIYKYYQNLL
jgi:hypothetical protein